MVVDLEPSGLAAPLAAFALRLTSNSVTQHIATPFGFYIRRRPNVREERSIRFRCGVECNIEREKNSRSCLEFGINLESVGTDPFKLLSQVFDRFFGLVNAKVHEALCHSD
jgi:hypothetical protein